MLAMRPERGIALGSGQLQDNEGAGLYYEASLV